MFSNYYSTLALHYSKKKKLWRNNFHSEITSKFHRQLPRITESNVNFEVEKLK